MTKLKKPQADTAAPSEDLIAEIIHEGQTHIADGKTKLEAETAIYRLLENSP